MSKLAKLLNKFPQEPTKDELVKEFLEILRVDEDCFNNKTKSIITQDNFALMKSKKTHSGIELEVGDTTYFCFLTESMKRDDNTPTIQSYLLTEAIRRDDNMPTEISLKLIKIIDQEFTLFILQPEKYLRRIIVLDHDNQTYSINRSSIEKDLPTLILKPLGDEAKENIEFAYFKYVKKNFKKSNKK